MRWPARILGLPRCALTAVVRFVRARAGVEHQLEPPDAPTPPTRRPTPPLRRGPPRKPPPIRPPQERK